MLAYQRGRVIGATAQSGLNFRRVWCIAQRHGDVAQPALVADAADRVAGQPLVEFGFRPRKQFAQAGVVQPVAWRKRRVAELREAVPRTAGLAVVTAVDAVADQRPEFLGNGAVQLDGQVGDAAPGIDLIRRGDGLRRADVEAGGAGAAMFFAGRIR